MNENFIPGSNIAMKVPVHEFESTVAFYRDILGFELVDASSPDETESVTFKFGDKNLWIDKISGISQAEVWLEVVKKDIEKASKYLEENDCVRRDEIEPLPDSFKGFWISSPANIIHLINEFRP
jgi:catechol 2,3-dioxygenase-like lactoylglutathione lyase family enzyme